MRIMDKMRFNYYNEFCFLKNNKPMKKFALLSIVVLILVIGAGALASSSANSDTSANHSIIITLFWIALLLVLAKVASLLEKIGQPSVLGELLMGVIIGNLFLLGINFFEPIKSDTLLAFLAELGVIILLFQVGLESNIAQMKKVGLRAFLVAIVGVICPFILGTYIVGPLLFPGLSSTVYLFLGAALTATSVGITARVFKDLGKLKTSEAQIVLGAAVIDDVIGLIILAVVSAIATIGSISLGTVSSISFKAIAFLIGAIVLGQFSAPFIGKLFSKIHTGIGMKFTMAVSFALVFAYLAGKMGLAPIVGAFAAGLVLDPVHFKTFKRPKAIDDLLESSKTLPYKHREKLKQLAHHHSEKHVEELIEPLSYFLVPLFFITTGMNVRLDSLFNIKILIVAIGITLVAIFGKYVFGFFAGKVNKNLVGFGMVPRGEEGLIFASIGSSLGILSHELFSVIVIMVIFTTLVTPPILTYLIKKQEKQLVS